MEKQKDSNGFVENEEFDEMVNDSFVESMKKQYLPFYDDVTSVRMEAGHPLGAKEQHDIIDTIIALYGKKKALLFYCEFGRRNMMFLLSKKFKENLDKMAVKGSKVVFAHPEYPDRHDVAIVQSDGVRYEGGVPVFDLFMEPKNCVDVAKDNDLGPYFALFWRPYEEEK